MRELLERFSYRFQVWQKERQWIGEPAGGGNPLRIVAILAVVSLLADLFQLMGQRPLDAMVVVRVVGASTFFFLYLRLSRWAWHVGIVLGPVFLLQSWLFTAVGWHPPPRPAPATVQLIVTAAQLVFLVGITIWLFRVRGRYLRYIADAQSAKA